MKNRYFIPLTQFSFNLLIYKNNECLVYYNDNLNNPDKFASWNNEIIRNLLEREWIFEISQQKAAAIIGSIKRKNLLKEEKEKIPNPAVIKFKYKRADGIIKDYFGAVLVKLTDRFSCYIFDEGYRTFLYSRVISILP